jgi:hypothetical protein
MRSLLLKITFVHHFFFFIFFSFSSLLSPPTIIAFLSSFLLLESSHVGLLHAMLEASKPSWHDV